MLKKRGLLAISKCAFAPGLFALPFFAVISLAEAEEFNTVMVSGRPEGDPLGPQLGPGIDFLDRGTFLINGAGQIAFDGRLTSVPSTEAATTWRWASGVKEIVAWNGHMMEFVDGIDAKLPNLVDLTDDGTILLKAELMGTGITTANAAALILVGADNATSILARDGDPVPNIPDATFEFDGQFSPPYRILAPDGRVAFRAPLAGPEITASNRYAIMAGTPGNLSVVVRTGDLAPHVGPSITHRSLSVNSHYGMSSGQYMVFQGTVTNPDATVNEIIHYNHAGTLSVLAKSGDIFPGTVQFNSFTQLQVSETGRAAFIADVGYDDWGVFAGTPGNVELLAHAGMSAPGTSGTFAMGNFFSTHSVQITKSGKIAFDYWATGGVGIWINDENGTRLAVQQGSPAGALAGVTLGGHRGYTFNDSENLAIVTSLSGNVTSSNDSALWLMTAAGQLELILREGDLFDADPTVGIDQRTISGIALGGRSGDLGGDIRSYLYTFNDSNVLAFALTFTDGSFGIFTADLAVPGDFDSDGDVDGADFVVWQTNFPAASGHARETGDADGDGDVDGADFVAWQANFPSAPAPTTVPESPASVLSLLMLPILGYAARRRRGSW